MIQVEIITANNKEQFEKELNEFLEKQKKLVDVKYSLTGNVISALVVYDEE